MFSAISTETPCPQALTFVTVFLTAKSLEGAGFATGSPAGPKAGILAGLGVTLGLLAISKQNYYVYLAFFLCLWLVMAWFDRGKCLPGLKRAGLVLGLAAVIFFARYGAHVWIVRHQPVDAAAKVAEQIAPTQFKPSTLEKGEGFWGSRMRNKGVTLVEMFTGEWKWHIFTFRSAFGKYGTMDIEAPLIFYRYIGWAAGAFATVLFLGASQGRAAGAGDGRSARAVRVPYGLPVPLAFLDLGFPSPGPVSVSHPGHGGLRADSLRQPLGPRGLRPLGPWGFACGGCRSGPSWPSAWPVFPDDGLGGRLDQPGRQPVRFAEALQVLPQGCQKSGLPGGCGPGA